MKSDILRVCRLCSIMEPVLPGRSHAGKSSLVAALVRAGATYYSDEYAVLDDDGFVHPFARALGIRHGSTTPSQHVPGLPTLFAFSPRWRATLPASAASGATPQPPRSKYSEQGA